MHDRTYRPEIVHVLNLSLDCAYLYKLVKKVFSLFLGRTFPFGDFGGVEKINIATAYNYLATAYNYLLLQLIIQTGKF